jgi:hypothetical protein
LNAFEVIATVLFCIETLCLLGLFIYETVVVVDMKNFLKQSTDTPETTKKRFRRMCVYSEIAVLVFAAVSIICAVNAVSAGWQLIILGLLIIALVISNKIHGRMFLYSRDLKDLKEGKPFYVRESYFKDG